MSGQLGHPLLRGGPGPAERARVEDPRASSRAAGYLIFAIILSLFFLVMVAPHELTFGEVALGLATWVVCCFPAVNYLMTRRQGIPCFEFLCLYTAFQYCLPVFLMSDPTLNFAVGRVRVAPEEMRSALTMSLLGLIGLQVGYYSVSRLSVSRSLPVIRLALDRRKAFAYSVLMGIAGSMVSFIATMYVSRQSMGYGWSLVMFVVSQASVSIAILVWLANDPKVTAGVRARAKFAVFAVTMGAMLIGMLRAELEPILMPVATLITASWYHTGRLPWRLGLTGLFLFLFFQPAKGGFRDRLTLDIYLGSRELGAVERTLLWSEMAFDHWSDVLSGTGPPAEETVGESFGRFDLIHLFGYTRSLTPGVVPYRNGSTYSYFLVSWIPRFLWPEKPLAQQANKDYAVAYGIQTEEGTETSMVGMAVMIEAFVNFGPAGVPIVMALNGAVLGLIDHMLNRRESGIGSQCIYLGIMTQFLNGMGSNTAALYSGLVQIIICNYVLMWISRERQGRAADLAYRPA